MKISINQMFRKFNNWCVGAFSLLFLAGTFDAQAQGDALFKAKCATCHQVFKNSTGPKLYQVREKWANEGGVPEEAVLQWVKDYKVAMAKWDYAATVEKSMPTNMQQFPELKDEDIVSIFDWVDAQVEGGDSGDKTADTEGVGSSDEGSSTGWIWIIMGVIFVVIILAIGGVRRQLKAATAEASGEDFDHNMTYLDEFKQWAWLNRKYVGLGSLVIVIGVVVSLFLCLYTIGIVEEYQPSQPIDFPHSVHAGINKIDCKYCHNSVTKSKTAGLPTVNVCMNCHKQITGRTSEQEEKIAKIYAAAGWDKDKMIYTGETKEIIWNKVHVLPDHVYFNHSQHVVVGGVDCKQCHGDMTKMTATAKVQPVSELNKVEGNIVLSKNTLTMGWCIECHGEKEISMGPLDSKKDGYYDEIHRRLLNNDKSLYGQYLNDGKVTVSELGGWECAKCHY